MLNPVSINNSDDNYIMLYGTDNHTLFNIDKLLDFTLKVIVYNENTGRKEWKFVNDWPIS